MEREVVKTEEITERRWHRVGACPVLEICVTYPQLVQGAMAPDAERFNAAYALMAEAFLSWAEGEPSRLAREAFTAMGAGAAYRFDRHVILCKMTAVFVSRTPSDEGGYLRIVRQVSWGTKRALDKRKIVTHEDIWHVSDMTLCRRPRGSVTHGVDGACRNGSVP